MMKLFTIGPTEMYENTKVVRRNDIPYFRTPEFSADVQLMDRLLKRQMGTAESSQTIYLTASGTGAMEATIQNCFSAQDKLLVIDGGSFGNRFAQICDIHRIPYESLKLKEGEALEEKHLEFYAKDKFTGLLVNLHETSTGQLYDIQMLKKFCQDKQMYLIVDAISTFLCDDYRMDEWGIDATIISTQKGLCVSPGMSMVVLNKRIIEEKVKKENSGSVYFDFKDYLENIKRGQTPFTPAVGIVYEILDMLQYIESEELQTRLRHIAHLAEVYRKNVCSEGISIPDFNMSNAITTTHFEQPVAQEIYQRLKEEYGMCVNPSGGNFGEYNFRVSHVGALGEEDMLQLAQAIKALYTKIQEGK